MYSAASDQIAQHAPPRRGAVLALAVDSNARPYDLTGLTLGDGNTDAAGKIQQYVVLAMQAETNDVYFQFSNATYNDLDDTAKVTAGNALTFDNKYGALLKAGNSPMLLRIDRALDKFLIVKAASTAGVLRIWATSEAL